VLGSLQSLDQHRLGWRVLVLQPAGDRAQCRSFRQLIVKQFDIQLAGEAGCASTQRKRFCSCDVVRGGIARAGAGRT